MKDLADTEDCGREGLYKSAKTILLIIHKSIPEMANNLLVSIIVPVYNVEPYIEQCCRSVFEQTYDNCEFIFVDDCGTDGSMDILYCLIEEYSHIKGRVKVIQHDGNKGLPTARKTGAEAARGEYIQFVDSDDYVNRNMTEHLVNLAVEHDADIVICDYDSGYCSIQHDSVDNIKPLDHIECMCEALKSNIRYVVFWNKLIRRSLIVDNQLYAPARVWCDEDNCVMFRALYLAKTVVSTSRSLYYYRKVGSSMSNSYARYRGKDSEPVFQMIRIMNAFVVEHNITDLKILDSMKLYKLGVLRLLALYADYEKLQKESKLFDSITLPFVMRYLKTKWPYVLVFLVWKSRMPWLLNMLRVARDKNWYIR